jgi:hypothetical protein
VLPLPKQFHSGALVSQLDTFVLFQGLTAKNNLSTHICESVAGLAEVCEHIYSYAKESFQMENLKWILDAQSF